MTPRSRSLATAVHKGALRSRLAPPSYTTKWDTTPVRSRQPVRRHFSFPPQPCYVLFDLSTNDVRWTKQCFSTALLPTTA
jgi:hypothetical protein